MIRRLLPVSLLLLVGVSAAAPLETTDVSANAFSWPIAGLSEEERHAFQRGRGLFRQPWVIAPSHSPESDGLGPLYNRLSCVACHPANGRGRAPERPEQRMRSMLVRLSVPGVDADAPPRPHPAYGDQLNEEGIPGVPGEGRASIEWLEHEVLLDDGTKVSLREPRLRFSELAYGPLGADIQTSARVGQPLIGMGLLDAITQRQLQTLTDRSRRLGLNGRVNQVDDVRTGAPGSGRFGHKANQPNLRQQTAAAMHGDLGITSSLFPEQNCTPAQLACQRAPEGGQPELTDSQLNDLEFYFAHLAPPARRDRDSPRVQRGERLFQRLGCHGCHLPSITTGEHPRFPRLSHQAIQPYTDLLLHDMGEGLADHRPDFSAGGREWRTAPLWGIGLTETVNGHTEFLHDGRARNLTEAILWHGGEAQRSRDGFAALDRDAREALLAFLRSL
ncbi:di-heme oxidoredictase family protein [Billgrantia endophytica]|uniref:Thiol oxidoreductase n=1 Tax=Billgrantia endophytica TaxID=2033802 RepID=A0A2N7TYN2_9GAMM|nr:di-heme oxidoredictase family protein [Halomonas endophytica]PMR73298.1 thiol oxidoreductase [Halomonas endophytica]